MFGTNDNKLYLYTHIQSETLVKSSFHLTV